MADENILVEFDYQNIVVIDPNKIIDNNNEVYDRVVDQEELVMYANLEAKLIPRTKLASGRPLDDSIQNVEIASINFLRPGGKDYLTDEWANEFTGKDTLEGKGLNQKQRTVIQDQKKPNEFYIKQDILNNYDTGIMGIESIKIDNDRSNTPVVDIQLIDIQGRALFEKGDQSPYAAFFNLPYPTFYLTIKGFYGKAVKYQLNLVSFSASFDGTTGNYRVALKFYGYKFTVLAETTVGSLFALPFMYKTKYEISQNAPSTAQQNAAQTSNGSSNQTLQSKIVFRGRQKINEVYSRYKEQKLISPDFPELTLYELNQRLDALETNILASFGQADFTPLSDIDSYNKTLGEYVTDVSSGLDDSFLGKYIDQNNYFIDNKDRKLFVLKKEYLTDQGKIDAISYLERIIQNYNKTLSENPTCGKDGTYEINGQKIPSSITNPIDLNDLIVTPSDNEINWIETFTQVKKRPPRYSSVSGTTGETISIELQQFKIDSGFSGLLQGTNFTNSAGVSTVKNYLFVFDGVGSFGELSNKMFSDISKLRQEVEVALQDKLREKLEGPNGLGFKPTLRNLFAVIFASVEGFYRLLDDVHRDAWDKRFHKDRKAAILPPDKSNSVDAKNSVGISGDTLIPVYPWPQYFVEVDVDGDERFELRYPGDPKEVSKTKGNNYFVWPEVEFVEEYIKAYSERLETNDPNGDSNESETVLRITLNAVEFPTSNIPYTDKEEVKYFYEIYERILMGAYFERLSKPGGFDFEIYKIHSDLEAINIVDSLGVSNPYLSKKLKEYAISGGNYLQFLQTISNQGTGLNWQSFIRGLYNTRYIRGYVEKDFSIDPISSLGGGSVSTAENANSLNKITEYLESSVSNETDFLDTAPFTDLSWSQSNLANGQNTAQDRYETKLSLVLNTDKKIISNYDVSFWETYNRPYTNYNYQNNNTPVVRNFDEFYINRVQEKKLLPTEGLLEYPESPNVGVVGTQTVSMLNTPYFINALQLGVQKSKTIGVQYPYVEAAYLFLNSLPLATLREKYNSEPNTWKDPASSEEKKLDYIFATLKKFGAVHNLPYAWVLKYGAIWHRYKTFIETGNDIIAPVWTSTNYVNNFDPVTNSPTKTYTLTGKTRVEEITLEKTVSGPTVNQTVINVGFYPKLINDIFYFVSGLDLFTTYTDSDIQYAVSLGLNLGYSRNASINEPVGYNPTIPNTSLNSKSWYSSFDIKNRKEFAASQKFKTIIFPSFGSTINQAKYEIFERDGNNFVLRPGQDIVNNSAVYNGSSRLFWGAPVYGYFDTTQIPLPPPDAYLNEILDDTEIQNAMSLFGDTNKYSKIEDIFGTFKKQILDEFEKEFLNYCRDLNDIEAPSLGLNPVATNFQSCLTSLLLVDEVPNTLGGEDYIQRLSNNQVKNIGNQIESILNYNITFKYGNPGEYNRQIFGTFSNPKIVDPIQYAGYVKNSLPGDGATTLVQSELLFPDAWKAMYTNVGFSSIPDLRYSDQGSYYTDFFIDNNVQFTAANVQQFAPLIKIYGTQKLSNNGGYNSASFTSDITDFINEKDDYVSQTLTQLFFKLQRQLPNIDSVNIKPINSAIEGSQPKIEYWETFKAFNDKWIAGNDYKEKTLLEDVLFLDRANRDIGDKVYFDVFGLKAYLFSDSNQNARVIDMLSKIIAENKFFMMPMASYINFWGINDIRPNTPPVAEGSLDLANSLFGTFTEVDTRLSSPKLVCFYAGKPSEHLDMKDNADVRFQGDTFALARAQDNPLLEKLIDKNNWSVTNKVVGFNVDMGNRNQSMFYNITLDQVQFAATTEANKQLTEMVNAAGGRKSFVQSVSLYNIYKNRSYECSIECLGNAMIQPTMYFNLRHVPMFNGPYMIQSVSHQIDSGNFRTTFKGVRMPTYSLPKINDQIASLNQNILNDLILEVRRKRQNEQIPGNPSPNITTVGNSINPNQNYKAEPSSTCFTSLSPNYNRFVGVETIPTTASYSEVANIIKQYTSDPRVIACVFYTMYLNGVKDERFYGFNSNYGGAAAGGYLYENIKYGGSLNTLFSPNYFCLSDSSGNVRPYLDFANLTNFIRFAVSFYTGKVATYAAYWANGVDSYSGPLSLTYVRYWPTERFKTVEELDKWITANTNEYNTLLTKATETITIMKKNSLL